MRSPHALIHIASAPSDEKQITESVEIDSVLTDIVWSTKTLECTIEFMGARENDTAMESANRFAIAMNLQERLYDLNTIARMSGNVDITDISSIFMEDIDQRADARFNLLANVGLPLPLVGAEGETIDSVEITAVHLNDDSETIVTIERE